MTVDRRKVRAVGLPLEGRVESPSPPGARRSGWAKTRNPSGNSRITARRARARSGEIGRNPARWL